MSEALPSSLVTKRQRRTSWAAAPVSAGGLALLPNEILQQISTSLTAVDRYAHLRQVCRRFESDLPAVPEYKHRHKNEPLILVENTFYSPATATVHAAVVNVKLGLFTLPQIPALLVDILENRQPVDRHTRKNELHFTFLRAGQRLVATGLPFQDAVDVTIYIRYAPTIQFKDETGQTLSVNNIMREIIDEIDMQLHTPLQL